MKRKRFTSLGAALLIVAMIRPAVVQAEIYSIDWFTVDGGGGGSSGGGFSVNGTIGQPDAGRASGGAYALDGGFWAIIGTVSTPGAPALRIQLTSTNTVLVAWPAVSGFNLQENALPGTTNWFNVTNAPSVVGDENQVLVSPSGTRLYRLKAL